KGGIKKGVKEGVEELVERGTQETTEVAVEKTARGVVQRADESIATFAKSDDDFIEVYRVFGDDARAQGFSWTTVDPRSVNNFRDLAGLPSKGASGANNSADFLIKGKTKGSDIIESRSALPL